MRIEIDGQPHRLHFFHQHFARPRYIDGGRAISGETVATLHEGVCLSDPTATCPKPPAADARPADEAGPRRVAYGIARCSARDPFDKRTGRALALTRALGAMQLTRPQRTQVWARYHAQFPRP